MPLSDPFNMVINYKINCPRQELHPDIMEILTEDESEELLQNDSDYEVIDSEE
ncbi:19420_t:CDS:2 [Rhizophagus irregularis]|nr:19420_t:CDS:2 [Rhizophagus irregularis]